MPSVGLPDPPALPTEPSPQWRWVDLAALCLLAFIAFAFTWHAAHQLSVGLRSRDAGDVWFESDINRVFENISDRQSDQYRTQVHPLFPLFAYPVCYTLHRFAHMSLNDSADAFLALTAAAWVVLMYLVIWRLGFDRVLAFFAALMGLLSASGTLFFTVPETYSLSSVSILLALALLLFTRNTRWASAGAVLASASALSITVTNWFWGLLLTLRGRSWKQWLQLSANAFLVVTLLWSVQKALMHTARFFTDVSGERQFVHHVGPAELLRTAIVFLFHSVITPAVQQTTSFGPNEDPIGPVWKIGLSFQHAWPGSGSPWGILASVCWLAVLVLGTRALLRAGSKGFALAILGFLALQFAEHALYGIETFLYALDWMPVLVILAVYGFQQLRRARWPAIILFTAVLAVNNLAQFQHIAAIIRSFDAAHPLAPPATVQQMRIESAQPQPCAPPSQPVR